MFPVLKALVSFFTGQGSLFDDKKDSLSDDEVDDYSVLIKEFRKEPRELDECGGDIETIERLEKEVRDIEGWGEELRSIGKPVERNTFGEESHLDAESLVQNGEIDICKTDINCSSCGPENKLQPSCESGPDLCEHRVGIITELGGDYGIIDKKLRFEYKTHPIRNLRVGTSINYVVFRKTVTDIWQLHKILAITDESWEETKKERKTEILKKTGAIDRKVIGQVENKSGRDIFVKPNIRFCLDDVESDFIPYKGDWLSVNALVELDESIQDFVGDILTIYGISPLRSKVISGIVTSWDNNIREGTVDQNVWFTQNECEPGFLPSLEDPVVVQAIESSQGACCWRAVSVISLETKRSKRETQSHYAEKTETTSSAAASACIKNGISVPKNISFGRVIFGQVKELTVEVSNLGKDDRLLLRGRFHGKKSASQISLLSKIDDGTIIGPGHTIYCRFRVCGKFIGQSTELFVFTFRGFKVQCYMDVEVKDQALSDLIEMKRNGTSNYKNTYAAARKMQFEGKSEHLMRGVLPIKPPSFVPVKLGSYEVPAYLWKAVFDEDAPTTNKLTLHIGEVVPSLKEELTIHNYCARFHALLHLEEIDLNIQIHRYDMDGVVLAFVGEYLSLEVPGLAEKRPTVLIGDRIKVVCPTRPGYTYEGYVHKVRGSEVLLKFHSQFHQQYKSEECSVHFVVSRGPLKRCHVAIDLAVKNLGENILFPRCLQVKEPQVNLIEDHEADDGVFVPYNNKTGCVASSSLRNFPPQKIVKSLSANGAPNYCEPGNHYLPALPAPKISKKKIKLQWYNPSLNHYQKEAVRNALKGEARPLPYVIFGPPGTGKTVTLVETILQIYSLIPESRILVSTPSNSSANLIAERLLFSKLLFPGDLVRLVAYHCLEEGTLPESLLPYSTTCDISDCHFGVANHVTYKLKRSSNASVLGRHRITVGTCVALGHLYTMGFPSGHFTHVCVDEAGQATEPELLISLGFLHRDWGQAILAGDPLQLGPVVSSRVTLRFGLGFSYLARLLECCPYRRDPCSFSNSGGYNPKLVTRLVMNYRSLPEILSLPSGLFYDSQLQPQIHDTDFEGSILKSLAKFLPNRDSPLPPGLVFHGVRGVNFQDADCPSWFNPQELVQIIYYLKDFFQSGLSPDQVGVITPYHKQVQKLRSLLTQLELPSPKIGSVEEFQGQERFVIILSTVRSSAKYIKSDLRYSLGFVASPQRLNVALTRARALLIIIGNPHLLSQDPYWRKTLAYCVDNRAYTGCDLPKDFLDLSCESSLVCDAKEKF